VFALVLTGPPGAGKTDVLAALSDRLVADDVRHATVEVEALTSAHPALSDEQWAEPVRAIGGLYRRFGYELLLVTVTVETQADLDATVAALGSDEHAVVRLYAGLATLRERIIAREPDGWAGLDQLLGASARLNRSIATLDGIALALSTDRERPETIAERIHASFRQRCAHRPPQPTVRHPPKPGSTLRHSSRRRDRIVRRGPASAGYSRHEQRELHADQQRLSGIAVARSSQWSDFLKAQPRPLGNVDDRSRCSTSSRQRRWPLTRSGSGSTPTRS
jgi:hypothetical protein